MDTEELHLCHYRDHRCHGNGKGKGGLLPVKALAKLSHQKRVTSDYGTFALDVATYMHATVRVTFTAPMYSITEQEIGRHKKCINKQVHMGLCQRSNKCKSLNNT